MLLPIGTDRRLNHRPWVNFCLIAVNVLVFLVSRNLSDETMSSYMLIPARPMLSQFISYQFIHANTMHLLGNMLFLYIFGCSVEDRLGKISYLCFYLAGGVIAGLGHAWIEFRPVLGASGAVSAVIGAYLALFPKTHITIVYWFFIIGMLEIPSMLLILIQIAWDAVRYLESFDSVAYLTHLSGYAYGFLIAMILLRVGLLVREPYDLLSVLEHRRRKAQFAALTRQGYQPWEHSNKNPSIDQPLDAKQKELMAIRSQINNAIADSNTQTAADLYGKLLELDSKQVMASNQQLDLANQLMSQQQYQTAAHAYELFLSTYGSYTHREQIELILGLIYARYLDQHQRASELLTAAIAGLQDSDQQELARQALHEITS